MFSFLPLDFFTDKHCPLQTPYSKDPVVAEVEAHLEDPGQVQDQLGHLREDCNGTCHQEERLSSSVAFPCHCSRDISSLSSF